MLRNRTFILVAVMALLLLTNVLYSIFMNWGLITVKVTDAPLGQIISSIEWQGWVKIYSNIPPDTKVTMYVDHVPLAEAMETLAANVDMPPPPASPDAGGAPAAGSAPDSGAPAGGTAAPGGLAAAPGGAGGTDGGAPGGGGGRRGGGFGGGVQWNLAFFVAPSSGQVNDEIRSFEERTPDDDTKVYTYQTQFALVAGDDDLPAADPRLQSWPGVKAPPATADTQPGDQGTAQVMPVSGTAADGSAPDATPAPPPMPLAQTYLQDFAKSANIWIMAPGSWAPDVSAPPPPDSSIIRAVENFVGNCHGSVKQAIILRAGRGGPRVRPSGGNPGGGGGNPGGGGGFGGGFADDSTFDRLRNAISGLPAEAQAGALTQLDAEANFVKQVQAAPPDQQGQMIRDHYSQKANGWGGGRFSPQKMAQRFQRMVNNRMTAQGKQ